MLLDFATLGPDQAYFAMIQAIIPRPIAWVLSDNGDGTHNLAPFSFFTGVTGEPPMLLISVGMKAPGVKKDTWLNIEQRGEFVVHIAHRGLAEAVVASAATLPHGESEVTQLGLATAAEPGRRLPRVVGPRVAMWCRRHAIHEVGDGPQGLILGRIEAMWVDDAAASNRQGRVRIDPAAVDPLARLGGQGYALLGERMEIKRPE